VIGIVRRYKVKVSSTYKFSCFQGVGDSIVCTPPSTHLCSLRFQRIEAQDNVNKIVYHENIMQR